VVESAEGLNLIVNDNGAAKQIAASAVGMQADWAETDETSPAFIKNKPVEEWDLDAVIAVTYNVDTDEFVSSVVVNSARYEDIKNKIIEGIQPKMKIVCKEQLGNSINAPITNSMFYPIMYIVPVNAFGDGSPEGIMFALELMMRPVQFFLGSDGSVFNMDDF
jgi:hypothetical protein